MIPKIFVGTMYCGEGDIDECTSMINLQHGVTVEHVIIRDLPEKDAHNALWTSWNTRKDSSDLFVKCDADTILISNTTLRTVWDTLQSNPHATGIQAPLYDYISDSNINGLNCFTKKVVFKTTIDELYCDRVDVGNDYVLRAGTIPLELIPAGKHCAKATPIQAFHYGLHRALKNQTSLLNLVRQAWKTKGDDIRAYALLGASATTKFMSKSGFNYSDKVFLETFNELNANFKSFKDKI